MKNGESGTVTGDKVLPVGADGQGSEGADVVANFETLRKSMVEVDHETHDETHKAAHKDIHDKLDKHAADNPEAHKHRKGVHSLAIMDPEDEETKAAQEEVEIDMLYQAAHEGDGKPKTGQFGTWDGVYANSLLNIFGVILFLRLGWVVGQAGIIGAICIELLATSVTTLTTMSMSAIATNGKVKGGGAYYMISRSLGPETGGAIGILFFLGLSVAIAMYCIGFIETLLDNLGVCPNTLCDGKTHFNTTTCPFSMTDPNGNGKPSWLRTECVESDVVLKLTSDKINDLRIWGLIKIAVLLVMALMGTGWIMKMQIGALASLVFIIFMVIIMTFVDEDEDNGFVGWGGLAKDGSDNLAENMKAGYDDDYGFFQVFSVFFPAVTGIMAGANVSGMLKTPAESIPKGTFYAIFHSTIIYALLTVALGAACQRESLKVDMLIMGKIDFTGGFLILYAVYGATFTGALASLVGAPQILYALAKDGILPLDRFTNTRTAFPHFKPITMTRVGLDLQGREFRNEAGELCSEGDPVLAYFLSFIIGGGCICIGELNAVAPLISMFFLMTYGLINWSCFVLMHAQSPSWRPSFKYRSAKGSLIGAILCVFAMFLTDVYWALGAMLIGYGIRFHIEHKVKKGDVHVHWGTARDAARTTIAVNAVAAMRNLKAHARTFRPSFLILSDDLEDETLGRFACTMRAGHGSVVMGHVKVGDPEENVSLHTKEYSTYYQIDTSPKTYTTGCIPGFGEKKEKERCENSAFVPLDEIVSKSFYDGAVSLMQVSGIGAMRPNVVQLRFKKYWETSVSKGGTLGKGVFESKQSKNNVASMQEYIRVCDAAIKMHFGLVMTSGLSDIPWHGPAEKGEVHVWWLAPDGGLTILLPQIMTKSKFWKKRSTHVKLFFVLPGDETDESVEDGIRTATARLRVKMELVFISLSQSRGDQTVTGAPDGPLPETVAKYDALKGVTPVEKQVTHNKHAFVYRWLRISELIAEHSKDARFVFSSLPKKAEGQSGPDWYGLVHMLQSDMPPMCMIRGNNLNCLTMFQE